MTYTSKEQGEELVKLGLNPKTADMCYFCLQGTGTNPQQPIGYVVGFYPPVSSGDKPCWSTDALLDIIYKNNRETSLLITHERKYWLSSELPAYDTKEYDNIFGACYDMIVWLLTNKKIEYDV